jgi:ABC-2 type transport system ATP-binding protein
VRLDSIRPTGGRVFVFGIETSRDPVAIHRRTGYLLGQFRLYDLGLGVWGLSRRDLSA